MQGNDSVLKPLKIEDDPFATDKNVYSLNSQIPGTIERKQITY
jgi:hypothetical protein